MTKTILLLAAIPALTLLVDATPPTRHFWVGQDVSWAGVVGPTNDGKVAISVDTNGLVTVYVGAEMPPELLRKDDGSPLVIRQVKVQHVK